MADKSALLCETERRGWKTWSSPSYDGFTMEAPASKARYEMPEWVVGWVEELIQKLQRVCKENVDLSHQIEELYSDEEDK